MVGMLIASLFGLILVIGILFLNLSPEFGKAPSKELERAYAALENYQDGRFINGQPSPMDLDNWKLMKEFIRRQPNRTPSKDIATARLDSTSIANRALKGARLTWFGHSAILLEMDGMVIFIDPMLGNVPAPHPLLGGNRYSKTLPLDIEKLPFIDVVILSHDHYDHLDYGSIIKLKDKVGHFFTPLGLGSHLRAWGVPREKIDELNWWESVEFKGLKLVCTPARHFSGRGLFDRAKTLWCSWVIQGRQHNIFFSGDSGYGDHFQKIGEQYGPFDIAMMECGQYHQDWKLLHMMPEETVQAALDVQSKLLLPIHWGAFTLALHDWTDPVERATSHAAALNMPITTPKIGEPVMVGNDHFPAESWWLKYMQ